MKKDVSYPWIWLLPITANPRFAVNDVEMYEKTWNIALLFFDKDAFDATEGPSNDILDQQDAMVDRFILRLNEWAKVASQDIVGDVTIRGVLQQPFYKDDAGIHTGWLLTFAMTVPDDFNYCTPQNVYLDAADN